MKYTEEHMMEFPLESLVEINVKVSRMRKKYNNRTIDVPVLHVSARGDDDYIKRLLFGDQEKSEVVMSFNGFHDCEEIIPEGKEKEYFESDILEDGLKQHVESLEEILKNNRMESADSLEGYLESLKGTMDDCNVPYAIKASTWNTAKEEWGQYAKQRIIKSRRDAEMAQTVVFGDVSPFS